MKKTAIALSVAGVALMAGMSFAQMQQGPIGHNTITHGSMAGSTSLKGDAGPSSLAFHAVNMKMHSAMDIAFTGNADVDFVKGMIAHHAGAIEMAKVVLAFGKDPEVKNLAESIITAQETEVAQMQDWLKKKGQ